ncbi:MAG: nucleotide disphospho-sugar-binding domain-containing protein [Microbacteriaceae bacterium]
MLQALQEVDVRAVVATGWGALAARSTDDIFVVNDVPHEWLFPRVDAVVHHGGSGTTAAGLRAGKPTLICPVLGDQPFWGRRIHELGTGPRPLPLRSVTPHALAGRILELISREEYAAASAAIGEQIASEDGTGDAVEVLQLIEAASAARRLAPNS